MKKTTEKIFTGLFQRAAALEACRESIRESFELLRECFGSGYKLLICGNGGSAADSEHIVGELMKAFRLPRPLTTTQRDALREHFPEDYEAIAVGLQRALPAISLVSQTSLNTAFANDVSADLIFAQQVLGYGVPGDLLIAISTSGNSANVVNAVKTASAFGLGAIGMTGERESALSRLCTTVVRAPAAETSEVQEYHIMIYHALCAMIEVEFFEDE